MAIIAVKMHLNANAYIIIINLFLSPNFSYNYLVQKQISFPKVTKSVGDWNIN